jgi:uncharacterized protein YbjT (DUF2867 family)
MTATLIGATGLIGNLLLQELLNDPFYNTVRILIRRPLDITHPKLEKKIVDFSDSDSLLVALSNSDVVFCSVGTTQKKVKGDKELYRKIDYDIPVKLALLGKMTGCEKFILVSSVGADKNSGNFYLKLKGEVEKTVIRTGLKSIHIMRPSMLLGERKEFRAGEKIISPMMKLFAFAVPEKFKAIEAGTVAMAMAAAGKRADEGFFVYEYAQIKQLSENG